MKMRALLYYRNKLDSYDQSIYDSLVNQWMHLEKDIQVDIPHCNLSMISQSIHFDYPLLFYVNYYHIRYSMDLSRITVKGEYVYSRDEIESLLKKCEHWGKYIYSHMAPNISVTEKALWLHDVILNNVKYSDANGIRSHNLIGVVSDGMAVCEGISMAYKYLCDLADVPCINVSGTLNGYPHSWNMVWINRKALFVDVTNDINSFSGKFRRDNFLMKHTEMTGYSWNTSLIHPDRRD